MIECADENFSELVLKSEKTVLVDFWASWCAPCRALGIKLEKIKQNFPEVLFVKVNIEQNTETPKEYGVKSIPYLALFKNGKKLKELIGNVSEQELSDFIQS